MNEVREIELNGRKLRVYSCGKVESFHHNKWRELTSKSHENKGYKQIQITINKKKYSASRVIFKCFNPDFDLNNVKLVIDHINRNSTDNRLCNLRVLTIQQNLFNTNAKGYSFHKYSKKWQAEIRVNYKAICLGYFNTEDEAQQAYLEAKEKYHII